MAKDILVNIKERDILLGDSSSKLEIVHTAEWGNIMAGDSSSYAYLNIMIPNSVWESLQITGSVIEWKFSAPYNASYLPVVVRIIKVNGSTKTVFATSSPLAIKASQLIAINSDGVYRAVFKGNTTQLYSGVITDFAIGDSDNQSAELLAICVPGNNYRYPTTGADITRYNNSVVENTDMPSRLQSEFDSDGKSINSAEFDSSTGSLNMTFDPEYVTDDTNLLPVEELEDLAWLQEMTDEKIKEVLGI